MSEDARQVLERQPANRPASGTAIVTDKGLSGEDAEAFFVGPDLDRMLIRPARTDEKQPRYFPIWLRQRIEAIIWTLKTECGELPVNDRVGWRISARAVRDYCARRC